MLAANVLHDTGLETSHTHLVSLIQLVKKITTDFARYRILKPMSSWCVLV